MPIIRTCLELFTFSNSVKGPPSIALLTLSIKSNPFRLLWLGCFHRSGERTGSSLVAIEPYFLLLIYVKCQVQERPG